MSDATAAFEELGISPALAAAAARRYARPTSIQRDAIPLLRRGNNVVLHASAGAGVLAAYGLALLDRLSGDDAGESDGARALVLVLDADTAHARARSMTRLGLAAGLRASTLDHPGAASADVVFATPAAAMQGVRASTLKLDGLVCLVLDGFDALTALGGGGAIETLTTSVPKEAQRIIVTGELNAAVSGFVERHVRRAVNVPARLADARAGADASAATVSTGPAPSVSFVVATDDALTGRLARLLLERTAGPALVLCRTQADATALADDLALDGVVVGTDADAPVRVMSGEAADVEGATADFIVSHHPPFDAESLLGRHARGGLVTASPRELAHLGRIAAEAGVTLSALPDARTTRDDVDSFRDMLRKALDTEDIGAQLLVLDPLFAERSAAEVAAAAAALLRQRATPGPGTATPIAETPSTARTASATPAPAPPAYTRLFISIGEKDGIGPGDLVGMITGEANIRGAQVGKIEIRDTFSIVEVDRDVGERVIRALNGTTVRGRSVRADYDRKPSAGRPGGGRGGPGGRGRPGTGGRRPAGQGSRPAGRRPPPER